MNFRQSLNGKIPKNLLKTFNGHFEVIGDIAVLRIPDFLKPYKKEIGYTLLEFRKDVSTVLQKTAPLNGEKRVGSFEYLAGKNKTVTLHKEGGYLYETDLSSVFFSPALYYERMRISSMVNPGEKVIVPFSGGGPFAVPAAEKGAEVTGIDINPAACRYFMKNTRLNGVREKADVICGDAMDISCLFPEKDYFSRAIIPTAYGMDAALFKTAELVKTGGFIHFYTFKNKGEAKNLKTGLEKKGLETIFVRPCGNVAPAVSRWVFDLKKVR
ncbi:tRNA (guanine37-N1)-methyltransferase [Methanomicrobium sp. W14]|uniref:class I SAM-dependent methyltransferase n=1 Tax=Methanomicrobium sp. W14 TaxID=2817839 RepID=UPI001AE2C435|nr:hypothetical protein [Methanomicrobium sp. W14]MBP2133316.1 tRNA (guanine37-N1)-methyltransferase [Methanomicrobium sp. W14]